MQYKHNSDKGSNLEPKTSTILGNRQEKHKNLLRGYSKTFHSERRSRVPDKVDGRCLQKLRNRGLLETEVVGVGKAKGVRGLRVTLLYDDDTERLGVIRHFTESELFGIFRRVPEIRKAANAIRETIRSWELARLSPLSMESIAGRINVTVRGWIDYYGAFFKSELKRVFRSIDEHLIRWMMRKYICFRGHWCRSWRWLGRIARQNSGLFVHWEFLYGLPLFKIQRLHGKSRVS